MPIHNHIECDGALSDLILQAARQAIPSDVEHLITLDCGPRNKPLMPLLIGLVEALRVTARAVEDNALDEGYPVDNSLVSGLQMGLCQINVALTVAKNQTKN